MGLGLHESRRLRSTLEYFGISFGSGISFGVRMPVISGHDPEIYLLAPSHNGIEKRNMVAGLRDA